MRTLPDGRCVWTFPEAGTWVETERSFEERQGREEEDRLYVAMAPVLGYAVPMDLARTVRRDRGEAEEAELVAELNRWMHGR